VSFGPDVTRAFLRANNLKFVVRSHECVRSGYDEPFSGADRHLLCTIFSASDYGGAGNSAAILRFRLLREGETAPASPGPLSSPVSLGAFSQDGGTATSPGNSTVVDDDKVSGLRAVEGTNLCYTVHYYYVDPSFFDAASGSTMWEHPANAAADGTNGVSAGIAAEGNNVVSRPPGPPVASSAGIPFRKANSDSVALGARRQSLEALPPGVPLLPSSPNAAGGTSSPDAPPPAPGSQHHRRTKSMSSVGGVLLHSELFTEEDEDAEDALRVSDRDCVLIGARTTLRELIVSRLDELRREFHKLDPRGSGVVSKFQWVNVMRETMGLHVRWISLMQVLVLDSHFRSWHGKKMVDYELFLQSFEPEEGGVGGFGFDNDNGTRTSAGVAALDQLVEDEYTALLADRRDAPSPQPEPAQPAQPVQTLPTLPTDGSDREGVVPPAERLTTLSPAAAEGLSSRNTLPEVEMPGSASSVPLAYSTSSASKSSPAASSTSRKRVSFLSDGSGESPAPALTASPQVGDTSPRKSVSFAGSPPPGAPAQDAAAVPTGGAPRPGKAPRTFHEHNISGELLEVLYIDHKEVESAFAFFDRDNDGCITHDEFRAACKELNKYLPRGQRIRDVEALLALMDFEETGEIPFNNFFELFRLSEMKLNVAIDEEDTLAGSLHHPGDNKDLVRRSSVVSMSGLQALGGSFYGGAGNAVTSSGKLEVHGVQIDVDSELSKSPSGTALRPRSVSSNRGGGGAGSDTGTGSVLTAPDELNIEEPDV
jgi:Ca2+-binding EF-hand superfamily protein